MTPVHACLVLRNFREIKKCDLNNKVINKQIVDEKQMQCCGHHEKPDKLYSFSLAHRRNVREALSEFVCKNIKNIEVKTNGDQIFFVTFQFSKNNATF